MVVRVQKSKEDGLDFSLALSFYLLFLRERYPSRRHRRFLVLSLEWLVYTVGSDGFSSRAIKKKKEKKKLM